MNIQEVCIITAVAVLFRFIVLSVYFLNKHFFVTFSAVISHFGICVCSVWAASLCLAYLYRLSLGKLLVLDEILCYSALIRSSKVHT